MNTPKILIAEDELSLRTVLKKLFLKKGFAVESAGDGLMALNQLKKTPFDLAIVDIKMPSLSGFEVLEAMKKEKIRSAVIIMTAQDTMKNAVEAMKKGAYDYITKPFELDELEMIVDKALEARRLAEEVQQLRQEISAAKLDREAKIIGQTRSIREVYKTIGKVSSSDVPILITGESGTGKELIAKAIHQNSPRSRAPFLAVNCAAIPRDLLESEFFGYRKGAFTGAEENRPGYFETAHQGTLFLDEVGDLPLNLQAKLLRVLQEKEVQRLGSSEAKLVDVRILAATNQNLEKMVKEKKFREDLFFRLNVIPIHLPPLRERQEDIPLLAEYFLNKLAQESGDPAKVLSSEALARLQAYGWPGNIRELENVIKRAAILSGNETLQVQDFASFLDKSRENTQREIEEMGLEELIENRLVSFLNKLGEVEPPRLYESILEMAERPLIRLILKRSNCNQIRAAKILGINRNTLRKKIRELRINLKATL
ncbi:MAG TPA: two-component system response regulator [Deltaproteobacteria bacterium]|nr:two-component system response regulator [Deltaproteobacteria bacterium]